MKVKIYIFLLLLPILTLAQNFENQWTGYFSYNNTVDVVAHENKLIVASENAIFIYDLLSEETTTITSVQGLAGEFISTLYYSANFDVIVVGYQSGLMNIILPDQTIVQVIDILNKPTIAPNRKRINHFFEFNGNLLISTDYGISVYDLVNLEFGDSYFIGDFGAQVRVNQTTVFDGMIYAATENQVKRAPTTNPNLIDYQQWSNFYNTGLLGIQSFGNELYGLDYTNRLLQFDGTNVLTVSNFSQTNRTIKSTDQFLTVGSNNRTTVFDVQMNIVSTTFSLVDYSYTLNTAIAHQNHTYLATNEKGILQVPFQQNTAQQILPDGPQFNRPFALDATPGLLWVAFGEVTEAFNPYPLNSRGLSRYQDNQWLNIPFEEVLGARSISHIKINPSNPNEVFASSMRDGMLRIVDDIPTQLLNENNSSLAPTLSDNSIRVFGADFDRSNNLWFVQTSRDLGLHRRSPNGQFQSVDLTPVMANPFSERGLNRIALTRDGTVFMATLSQGVLGYNPTNNSFTRLDEGLGNGNLPNSHVRALAVDQRNNLWIGTIRGLRVLFNTAGAFQSGGNRDAQPIIVLDNDGTPQELLFQQTITAIRVDGANNKWIATANSGVFYISANGQETIFRFTRDNSPLPSNSVSDIAIDPNSGEVFFATNRGLVSFRGTAVAPSPSLSNLRAYPNPVRPNFSGKVTIDGLTDRANVKITDVNGNLVFEQVSQGGSIQWDTTAFGRRKVSSGVYFIMATERDGSETKIAKLMIIR